MSRYDNFHGDEHEIEYERRELKEQYEDERADEWQDDPDNW